MKFHSVFNRKNNSYPKHISFQASNTCNLNCVYCGHITQKHFLLLKDVIKIHKAFSEVETVGFDLYGEPLLNEEIFLIINYIKSIRPNCYIYINTNAELLTEDIANKMCTSELNSITISIDSYIPESHNSFRKNSSLEKIISNIQTFYRIKEKQGYLKPNISCVIAVLRKGNYYELHGLIQLVSDLKIKTLNVNGLDPYKNKDLLTDCLWYKPNSSKDLPEVLNRCVTKAKTNSIELILPNFVPQNPSCKQIDYLHILANGDVMPCCLYRGDYKSYVTFANNPLPINQTNVQNQTSFGNIFSEGFEKVWFSENYIQFRNNVKNGRFPNRCNCMEKYGLIYQIHNHDTSTVIETLSNNMID